MAIFPPLRVDLFSPKGRNITTSRTQFIYLSSTTGGIIMDAAIMSTFPLKGHPPSRRRNDTVVGKTNRRNRGCIFPVIRAQLAHVEFASIAAAAGRLVLIGENEQQNESGGGSKNKKRQRISGPSGLNSQTMSISIH